MEWRIPDLNKLKGLVDKMDAPAQNVDASPKRTPRRAGSFGSHVADALGEKEDREFEERWEADRRQAIREEIPKLARALQDRQVKGIV